ncbi:DUF6082 family protein [Streptomyces boluensis]|uniref:Peptide transporter permease SapC n=1 Tax=Streptomyces boluensis TaxID=1775135 RepID=A0A964UN20_9ACTN|nr:DUF6082 family protein [Streptomyces boluensis]NBE51200.1 peptide transporter permease SapC [Streptomyces boluensis]
MKIGTAVLLAGTAVAGVGMARLLQEAKSQWERTEATLARNQLDWLTQISTDPAVASKWAPAGMAVEEYMGLMSANSLLCSFSLRDRLGRVSKRQRDLYASMIMDSDVARRYWDKFGHLRVQEAVGDPHAEQFNDALVRAADRVARADRQDGPAPA